ncbi:HAD family hydrolase [Candidatus Formimonas warabiya]
MARLCEGNYYEECAKAGIDLKKVEAATGIFEKTIKEQNCQIPVFPGIPEIMTATAQRFPSYIVTSNSSIAVAAMLKHHQIEGIREILGFEAEKSKAKKISYVKALFPGEKTYFIGDTSGDILEAHAGGVDVTSGVTWGWHSAEVLTHSHPDYLFHEVSELRDLLYALSDSTNDAHIAN